ncbi:hypothetical protein Sango_2802500 [Sesamum angolense]|uniref:DDE Tnp4 domain-containing protein n=1 Tax=Sesamum angolense TaxID=2727404 RepID=A0AAE1T751_9LAMI|nr:hypothetical protein Sango_2802500 [Sesamum angolense]
MKHDFIRSGRTISKHFHSVLKAVLRLSSILLARPLPVDDECQDSRWRWFKGCLGALDGTHIEVRVPDSDKGRYWNRKGQISTNVLGLCNIEGMFTYVLSGWEGSAADGRVLRDAVHRPAGVKVPTGNYYLCDNGYGNVEGFLTPYRVLARNVIERTFGLLKTRWGILRSPSYYPIRVQNQIIVACCLLHNFVRMEMPDDPLEGELPDEADMSVDHVIEVVSTLDATPQWTAWRDALATDMYTEWTHRN